MQPRWIILFTLTLLCGLAAWGAYIFLPQLQGQFNGGCNYDANGNLVSGDPAQCRVYKCGDPDVPDCGEGRLAGGGAGQNYYLIRDRDEGESCAAFNVSVGPLPQPYCCKDGVMIGNGGYTEQCIGEWSGLPGSLYCDTSNSTNGLGTCKYPDTSPPPNNGGPRCGNGVKEGDEECDAGTNNVPSTVANKDWFEITPQDAAVLDNSNCLDTCTIAECSDKNSDGSPKDNDDKNGANDQDRACYGGAYGEQGYLPGYNVENCPMCQREDEDDNTTRIALKLGDNPLTAATLPLAGPPPAPYSTYWCRGGYLDLSGNKCGCGAATQIQMIDGKCVDIEPDSTWTWSCTEDGDCAKGYRCAFYVKESDVQLFRCKRLISEGDWGCRSRWDCEDNYKEPLGVGKDGMLQYKDPTPFKCIASSTTAQGKCCGPNTDECKRTAYQGQAASQVPQFNQCQQPPNGGFPGLIAGGDGGGNGGNNGNGDGGQSAGDNGSNGSSDSSASACFTTNTCVAITKSGNNYAWIMPASCPLTGTKRTCYSQCLAGLLPGSTLSSCESRCNVSESDLGMCPCKSDYDQCAFSCAIQRQQCNLTCGSNNACLQGCLYTQSSCVQACGRRCPSSSGSTGSQRNASSQTSSQVSNVSAASNGASSDRTSSSSRSSSSSSKAVSSPGASNGSNNSNGSNQSGKSSQGFSESFSSKKSSGSDGSAGSNTSSSSNTSGTSSGGSSDASASSQSSSSIINGVCCSAGNCDPFGRCSNPFVNYASCLAVCGGGSSQSNRSNSSSSVSSSHSSKNSTSSGRSNSSTSVSTRSSSVSSSSKSSSSSSSRSSSSSSSKSSRSSNKSESSVRICTDAVDCPSGVCKDGICVACTENWQCSTNLCVNGVCVCLDDSQCSGGACINGRCTEGNNSAGNIGGIGGITTGQGSSRSLYGYTSSNNGACTDDSQCAPGQHCILNRCLSAQEIAQLPSFCGNGRIDVGEICDKGAENSDRPNASCRPNCTPGRCGDGIIDTPLEQCDDGDIRSGDGCSATCLPERAAPPTALPATTIELPLTNTNKGDIGSANERISGMDSGNGSISSSVPSTPDTGPAALAVMIAGGAAGWLYRRRK